jgi:hypothetical protein
MSNLMSVAAAGVQAGMSRFDSSAVAAVKASMPGSNQDQAAAAVALTTNEVAAKADIEVFKMADKTVGALLDVTT